VPTFSCLPFNMVNIESVGHTVRKTFPSLIVGYSDGASHGQWGAAQLQRLPCHKGLLLSCVATTIAIVGSCLRTMRIITLS
jgi:uncharacterized membrane protein (UPF0136 family)